MSSDRSTEPITDSALSSPMAGPAPRETSSSLSSRLGFHSLARLYTRLTLPAQIALPLIVTSATIWLGGGVFLGHIFAMSLEQKQLQETDAIAALIERELTQAAQNLLLDAKLLAETDYVRQGISTNDPEGLSRNLRPTQVTLSLDIIKVVVPGGQVFVDLRQETFADATLYDAVATTQVLSGERASSRILAKGRNLGRTPSLLIGTAPITTEQGQLIGGVIVGNPIDNELLTKISEKTKKHIVAFDNTKIIATSLPSATKQLWKKPEESVERVIIDRQPYLAQSVLLSGLDRALLKFVVLNPLKSVENDKRTLWLTLGGICGIGIMISMVLTILIAKMIVQRIRQVADAMETFLGGDVDSRAPLVKGDPFDRLSNGFNSLADKFLVQEQKVDEQLKQLSQNFMEFRKEHNHESHS